MLFSNHGHKRNPKSALLSLDDEVKIHDMLIIGLDYSAATLTLFQRIREGNICSTFNTDHRCKIETCDVITLLFSLVQVWLNPIPRYSAYGNVVGQDNKAAIISETK